MPRSDSRRTKVALVSSGLGNTNRGFEISTARWYEALREHTQLDVRLYCGGEYPGGKRLWNFPRDSAWTLPFRILPFASEQRRWELCYGAEQVSFWSALNFELIDWRPDIVWVKDVPLAHMLIPSRHVFGLDYKLIFANGGMLKPDTYENFDVIQQISLQAYDESLAHGIPRQRMELISNCFPPFAFNETRESTRRKLGYGDNDIVVICVAAWNRYHKRIDYLLNEVAQIPDSRVKLLLCGAPEVDSRELQSLGAEKLGRRVKWLTVEPQVVPEMLQAADIFVLPSLRESLGNALVEAALCGLPIITHPHSGAQFAIQDEYWMTDLSQPGSLTQRLSQLIYEPAEKERIRRLQSDVSMRFGARALARKFEEMVARTANSQSSGTTSGAANLLNSK